MFLLGWGWGGGERGRGEVEREGEGEGNERLREGGEEGIYISMGI